MIVVNVATYMNEVKSYEYGTVTEVVPEAMPPGESEVSAVSATRMIRMPETRL